MQPVAEGTRVLVVDDEESIRHMLQTLLGQEGYRVRAASDGEAALRAVSEEPTDLVITDVRMPGKVDGIGLVEKLTKAKAANDPAVIVMSAYGSKDLALQAIRRGAFNYVNKPFTADEILLAVAMAAEHEKLRRENRQLKQQLEADAPNGLLGSSPAMQVIFATIRKIANYRTTVLVTGESGTGKELVARAIHDLSPQKNRPFVPVNCGAIPETLIESELFGHAKGAFTGAHASKKGLVEEAAGGTLFLDEIGELPGAMQVKLLRLLQESEVRRVGETKTSKIDVRIVAATNRDLMAEVRKGRFREDLFYRLNVLPLHLPPLRDRKEDIPVLVESFLAKFAKGTNITGITDEALQLLMDFSWSGNVRELENTIERAVVLATGEKLDAASLPEKVRNRPAAVSADGGAAASGPQEPGDVLMDLLGGDLNVKKAQDWVEKELIRRALAKTNGNKTQASALLDLSARALLYKIRDYGLEGGPESGKK